MDKVLFIIVMGVIYFGAAAIGILLFGQGQGAALFGLVIGTIGFLAFYHLLLKKNEDE
jgi:hypothetical protein